jgi:hypothetical protein
LQTKPAAVSWESSKTLAFHCLICFNNSHSITLIVALLLHIFGGLEKMRMCSTAMSVVCVIAGSAASAATYSASYTGDVCSIPPSVPGSEDCAVIQQAGSPTGEFELKLNGLDANISSDAKITVTSTNADLFRTDAQGGSSTARNNPDEYFGFSLDTLFLGILFDASTADEAAINAGLAVSVQSNIDATGDQSVAPINLEFILPKAQAASLVADGMISATFNFAFPLDVNYNVNLFNNPAVTIEYDTKAPSVVPLPASSLLLLAGLGGLATLRRKRRPL